MQEANQESPHQILMLNSLGQTASVLPRPWCPCCRTAQELHGNAKFNTEDHNGKEALEMFFFFTFKCLPGSLTLSRVALLSLESPFREVQPQILVFPEILGLCRFPSSDSSSHQLKVQPHSLNIYLLLWHWQALLRQVFICFICSLGDLSKAEETAMISSFPFVSGCTAVPLEWLICFIFF